MVSVPAHVCIIMRGLLSSPISRSPFFISAARFIPPKYNKICVSGCKHLPTPGDPNNPIAKSRALGFVILAATNSKIFSLTRTILYKRRSNTSRTLNRYLLIASWPSDNFTTMGIT